MTILERMKSRGDPTDLTFYHYPELGVTVAECVLNTSSDDATPIVMGYEVFELLDTNCWHKADSYCHPDPTSNIEEAEVLFECSIKWDGCSDWTLGSRHWCGKEDMKRFAAQLAQVYELAGEALQAHAQWFN